MDFCYARNRFNIEVDPKMAKWQPFSSSAILYYITYGTYTIWRRHLANVAPRKDDCLPLRRYVLY